MTKNQNPTHTNRDNNQTNKNGPKIGIVYGGGDCAGLNTVLDALVKGFENVYENPKIYGFFGSFEGILRQQYMLLDSQNTDIFAATGGTILRTANKGDFGGRVGNNNLREIRSDLVKNLLKSYHELDLDCLFCVGGDGTMAGAIQFFRSEELPDGINMICLPKSIDNDLQATDYTIGFASSVDIVSKSLEDLKTTARSHSRILVVEVMGRHTGHIALWGGLAGSSDMILLPEIGVKNVDQIADKIYKIWEQKGYAIITTAEAVKFDNAQNISKKSGSTNEILYGGVGEYLAGQLNQRIESRISTDGIRKGMGPETRAISLGHLQRAGSPNWFDKVLSRKLAIRAIQAYQEKDFGSMVVCRGGIGGNYQTQSIKLENISQQKVVLDSDQIQGYANIGIHIL